MEILIAVFIFSILATIATAGLHTVIVARDRDNLHAQRLEQLQLAFLLMGRDIAQAVERPTPGGGSPIDVGESTLAMIHGGVVNPYSVSQRSTLQRVAYGLEKKKLMRLSLPVLDAPPDTQPETRVLLDNVEKLTFAVTGEAAPATPPPPTSPAPSTTPADAPSLPRAVQVTLVIKDLGTLTRIFPITGVGFETPPV